VILVLVVKTIRLVGSNANNVFSQVVVLLTSSTFGSPAFDQDHMYLEIHRHFVLRKSMQDSPHAQFRQILVVERERLEVRIFESEFVQLDLKFTDDAAGAEIQFYDALPLAILNEENEYKTSVREGWRAFDPTASHNAPLPRVRRTSAA